MKGKCEICEREKTIKKCLKLGMMICDGCRKEDCYQCGRFKPVAIRTKGGTLCNSCFQRKRYQDIAKHQYCFQCGFLKAVSTYADTDKPLCNSCRIKSNIGLCKGCNRERKIKARGFCGSCYNKDQRTRKAQKLSLKIRELCFGF